MKRYTISTLYTTKYIYLITLYTTTYVWTMEWTTKYVYNVKCNIVMCTYNLIDFFLTP